MYEPVYTMPDWYDGPREGIADLDGRPHHFESQWDDLDRDADGNHQQDSFLLSPVDPQTLAWALEDWAIWLRWGKAFAQGATPRSTHPALPEDRARHEELKKLLEGRLTV